MSYEFEKLLELEKDEYKLWLNDCLFNIYIKQNNKPKLEPISHLIHGDDISLALYSFYKMLSTEQQQKFQHAVAEVIYAFFTTKAAEPAYVVLFDLVKLGQMNHCLNNVAAKLGRIILTDYKDVEDVDELTDEEDNIFYLGLKAITSMAGTSVAAQKQVENALYTLIKSPNFKQSHKDYTATVLYALCVNDNSNCEKYFLDLYETLEKQFYISYETYDEDDMDIAEFLKDIEIVIGVEKMQRINKLDLKIKKQRTQISYQVEEFDVSIETINILQKANESGYLIDFTAGAIV